MGIKTEGREGGEEGVEEKREGVMGEGKEKVSGDGEELKSDFKVHGFV